MSLFASLFGTAPAQPQQQPAQQQQQQQVQQQQQPASPQPGNIPQPTGPVTQQAPGTDPNGVVPAQPLDQFKDLWAPMENQQVPNASLFANLDPAKLMEAAKATDFTKLISPDHLAAIQQGGDAATAAFVAAMNSVGQGVYAQSALATTRIVQQALDKQREQITQEIPGIVKRHTVSDNLRTSNPVLNNPAIQPLVGALETQFTMKYPNATGAEITKMAEEYLAGLGTVFNPQQQQQQQAASAPKPGETDWSTFL